MTMAAPCAPKTVLVATLRANSEFSMCSGLASKGRNAIAPPPSEPALLCTNDERLTDKDPRTSTAPPLPTSRLIAPPSPLLALLVLNVDASTYSSAAARMAPPPAQKATLLTLNVLL